MKIEGVVTKLLGTLNSNVDSGYYCQFLRGERVRRKAFGERSFHEGAGARTFLHRTQCMRVCYAEHVCACALGIWLSPVFVHRSADLSLQLQRLCATNGGEEWKLFDVAIAESMQLVNELMVHKEHLHKQLCGNGASMSQQTKARTQLVARSATLTAMSR